jgi:hypothetical protein
MKTTSLSLLTVAGFTAVAVFALWKEHKETQKYIDDAFEDVDSS